MIRTIVGTVTILLSCICLYACAQNIDSKPLVKDVGNQLVQPDSLIVSILGAEVSDLLFNPDKVNVFTIEPKGKVEEIDYEVEQHFIRKTFVGSLDKKFYSLISFLLLSNNNCYACDSTIAQTFYLPVIEFEYNKKKKTASVIISPNDGTWTVVSEGKRILNYNYRNPELVDRLVSSIQGIKSDKKDKTKKTNNKK